MKTIFLTLTILLSVFILRSQTNTEAKFVSGEVMVQLKNKSELPLVLKNYGLIKVHTVSDRFNIYLLKFDDTKTNNNAVINMLTNSKLVVNAQNNHFVSLRENTETIPNDSLFNQQWSLLNTGQGGGLPGADIDAINAWDITTGGLTALGDTIVVAILDGGSYLAHEDLSFWKNHAEIPNNSIDDDDNGYVDDYDGWNAFTHSGTIPNDSHGVHVSGIAGAIGNNDIGITGVNWTVKILPVVGDSEIESIVVEALSYIYVIRERYDQTDGAEGAFVVADNCSFGVNYGQPEDFPIWEAMYDSLGQLGILSMGATANRNWDIDEVGDVPTGFTTDFMISVTNTTNNDLRFTSAAYGDTTIDIAAPGTNIKSLGLNNYYTNKTGTSMATPHVTGAAALLMAAADSAFMLEYKNNPAQGALLIKNYLLNGADQLEDLQGIIVTGGRLNIFNSINLMLSNPVLTTNLDSAYKELPINTYATDSLIITNSGGDTLVYSITITDQADWFTLSQYEGAVSAGNSDTIIMQYNSNNIDTGYYNCTINIESEGDGKLIPVSMYVYDNVGVNEVKNISEVKVFPNPTSTYVNFSFNITKAGKSIIKIYNQFGNLVHFETKTANPGINNFLWDNKQLPVGVYYYRLTYNNILAASGKIVKM